MTGKPAPMDDELTREQIEALKESADNELNFWRTMHHPKFSQLCDLALRALREPATDAVRDEVLEEVLRGLRSEDDSTQLRAIIASVELLKHPASPSRDPRVPPYIIFLIGATVGLSCVGAFQAVLASLP